MWRLLAIFLLIPTLTQAGGAEDIAKATALSKGPYDYYCTDKTGARHEIGDVVCLISSSCQIWMAKCDMSLNNPMWRKIQDGCPTATLLQRFERLQPAHYSLPVNVRVAVTKS